MQGFCFRCLKFTLLFLLIIVCIQDILIFPGVLFSWFAARPEAPEGTGSFEIHAADGVQLQMWDIPAAPEGIPSGRQAKPLLLFHGNGGSMAEFFPIQRWLARLGFHAYSVDTRGFGASRGWPSERGIELDAEAAVEEIARREGVEPREVAIAGLSIGSGAAAYLAAKYQSKILILLSAFSNLRVRASEEPVLGFLSPFLRYDFPTTDYISRLSDTCLVVAHGVKDRIVGAHHSDLIEQAYQGKQPVHSVRVADAMHNDLVFRGGQAIAKAIYECSFPPSADSGIPALAASPGL